MNDPKRRILSHRGGSVIFTRRYLPAELISYVAVGTETGAQALERYFKSASGKAFAKKRFFAAAAEQEASRLKQVLVKPLQET